MKRMILLFTLILIVSQLIFAQESKTVGLSLQECVQMAVQKNINVRVALIRPINEPSFGYVVMSPGATSSRARTWGEGLLLEIVRIKPEH